ncbi:MAG: DsbC family protein [Alcaligenaceae bacterium]|nr:DsbC family protein [Alcaligenaceae bacterium]
MSFRIRFRGSLVAVVLSCLAALPTIAAAQDKVLSTTGNDPQGAVVISTEQVRQGFEERFPGLGVNEISATPFPGLFEIRIGSDLLYVDGEVNYVLQGSLIDARSRRDLTAQRLEALSKVDFAALPFDAAIKQVRGDGSRQMAVFEDPNCGYCKLLHKTLEKVDDVTIYTFLFPILSEDSHVRSRNIWCAEDRVAAWRGWMLENRHPAAAECETPVEANLALGKSLMVTGTPAIFFADGSRVNGALRLADLETKLTETSQGQ